MESHSIIYLSEWRVNHISPRILIGRGPESGANVNQIDGYLTLFLAVFPPNFTL